MLEKNKMSHKLYIASMDNLNSNLSFWHKTEWKMHLGNPIT